MRNGATGIRHQSCQRLAARSSGNSCARGTRNRRRRHSLHRPETRGSRLPGEPTRRFRPAGNRASAAAQLLPEGTPAREISLPRGRAHSILSRRSSARLRSGRRRAPSGHHVCSRPARPRPRAVAAAGLEQLHLALPKLVSRAPGRAAQSRERPPHHAGRLPHRRRRLAGSCR